MQLLDFPIKAYFSVRHLFPPKNEDNLLDRICYPESECLSDSSSQPIIKGHVFVNQETSHLSPRGVTNIDLSSQANAKIFEKIHFPSAS